MSEKRDTLPQGWEWKKLPDVVLFGCQKGFNPPLIDGQVPFIGMSDIDEKQGRKTQYILEPYEKVSSGKTKFQKNAVLVGKITPCTQNNKVSIVPDDIEGGFATTEVFALHCLDKMLPLFLNYYVRSDAINKLLVNSMIGATGRQRVPTETLKNLDIPLPPLEEQRRIVGVLDRLFGKVDTSIALLDESIASASTLMPSALNEVFEELGEKWEKKFLNQVTINHDGKRIPIKEDKRIKNINGYPYYGASGIVDYVDDYIFDGEYLLISEDGANLVIRKTPIAFIASGKFWVNNHAHIVQAIQEITSNKYLEYFFAHVDISLYITGAAQPKLSQKKLFEIPIIIPPLDIQTQTVAYLDALHVKADALKKAQEKKKEALLALKASLLESAFKGEL